MKSRISSLYCLCCSLLWVSTLTAPTEAQEATAKELPGISRTKPESGPFVPLLDGKGGYMVPYTESLERTNIKFEMIPVPGGSVEIGSPASEAAAA